MIPNICHIYGPFYLNNYGLCIFLGILAFAYSSLRSKIRREYISKDDYMTLIAWGTLVGIFGGRLLFILTNPTEFRSIAEMFMIWEGGLSILGSIIGITLFIPMYLTAINTPILPILDVSGLYAPLLIGISRFGCFFAGCCHGRPTSLPWSITYRHHDSMAPLFQSLHPTQIYSAVFYLAFFGVMYTILKNHLRLPGQLFGVFLMVAGVERALLDHFRGDQELFSWMPYMTIAQTIGLTLFAIGFILFLYRSLAGSNIKTYESI